MFFETKIDHYNSSYPDTFNMRYIYDDTYFNGGPLFFYTGNEGEIWNFYNNTGFLTTTLAQEFGALVVFAEHRYYGESMPFGNSSYQLENLKFLTVQNVFEDYLSLIKELKANYTSD